MNILRQYREYLGVKSYEFSIGAKFALFLFTFFMFFIIAFGISKQLNGLIKPYNAYSYKCKQILEKDKKFNISYFYFHNYKSYFGKSEDCKKLQTLYQNIINSRMIKKDHKEYKRIDKKIKEIEKSIRVTKEEYDDMLLEKISNQPQRDSILKHNTTNVKDALDTDKYNLDRLKKQKDLLSDLSEHREHQKLIEYLKINRESILQRQKSYYKIYPLKRILKILIFLIPLFFITLYLYTIYYKKEKFIIARLFLSVATVSGIYTVGNLIYFIYQIIPKFFFKQLIEFFVKNNLVFLLNYFIILLFMILFGIVIWQIQLRNQNSKKLKLSKEKHIKQNCCTECGCQKQDGYNYCPICGEKLLDECVNCGKKTIKDSNFCHNCGVENYENMEFDKE